MKYTAEQLKTILELHSLWLKNDKSGVRADLSGANLIGANLIDANLIGANLSDARLIDADLNNCAGNCKYIKSLFKSAIELSPAEPTGFEDSK